MVVRFYKGLSYTLNGHYLSSISGLPSPSPEDWVRVIVCTIYGRVLYSYGSILDIRPLPINMDSMIPL